jgi:hypothetical protein
MMEYAGAHAKLASMVEHPLGGRIMFHIEGYANGTFTMPKWLRRSVGRGARVVKRGETFHSTSASGHHIRIRVKDRFKITAAAHP